ncbi:hypothetical protein EJD97_011552, partial [Solanum chilense]
PPSTCPVVFSISKVLSTMAPKQDRIYARGRSKSVAPSARMVIGSDDKRDPEYVPPRASTLSGATRAPRATPKKVASSVVASSQSDEERTLTGTPSGSATNEEGASGSLGVSWSEEAPSSAEVPAPATAAASASSNEADSLDSTSGSPVQRVLTGSLPTMPEMHNLFITYRLEWTARPLGRYSEELVREFYASYVATLRSQIDRRAAPAKQAPLEQVRVRGVQVDISLPAIRRFLYRESVDATPTPLTAEFDYRWQIVKDGQLLREPSLRETTKRWMAMHLSVDGEGADWVTEPKGAIKKANLTFTAMFLWLLVRPCLSPTATDNIVTWDRAVLMAALIAGFEVDFAWLLQVVMQERAFKGTVDVGLIKDEANEFALRKGPYPKLPQLADDLADTVAQARTATQAASIDTTPVESIPGSSTAPSSSRTTPLPTLVPLARSITESEERLERKMVQFTERKIAEVNQRLDAFELRVVARPAPPMDVSTLQATVYILRADIDTILEARVSDSEALSVEPAEDTVLAALFATSEIPPPPPRESDKRRRCRAEDETRALMKEQRDIEAARRASLA